MLLQKMGYDVHPKKTKLRTMSAVYTLQNRLHLPDLARYLNASYDPELMNAALLKRNKVHFTCFASGKIIITGLKSVEDVDCIVYPTILEISI